MCVCQDIRIAMCVLGMSWFLCATLVIKFLIYDHVKWRATQSSISFLVLFDKNYILIERLLCGDGTTSNPPSGNCQINAPRCQLCHSDKQLQKY